MYRFGEVGFGTSLQRGHTLTMSAVSKSVEISRKGVSCQIIGRKTKEHSTVGERSTSLFLMNNAL